MNGTLCVAPQTARRSPRRRGGANVTMSRGSQRVRDGAGPHCGTRPGEGDAGTEVRRRQEQRRGEEDQQQAPVPAEGPSDGRGGGCYVPLARRDEVQCGRPEGGGEGWLRGNR